MLPHRVLTLIILLTAAQCSLGQDNPDYICGGEDDKDGRPVCECNKTVCYFKLNIEHFQVSSKTFSEFQNFPDSSLICLSYNSSCVNIGNIFEVNLG
jgi:hypothetical protein